MARFSARPSSMDRYSRHHSRLGKKAPKRFSSTPAHHKPSHRERPTPGTATFKRSQLTFVYAGNLGLDVKNADLAKFFESSGKVNKIDIRCGIRSHTVYATVLFASVEAATRALALNGHTMLGRKMVVRPRP
ncbi:hypothetical protein B0F90DRAFT_1715619 [Multifurca ochricompacta]|uniref:RRM domain-containing protein n=1 Tax=Multifurca ochricompacta TaxID=376703 RepID=A0AAD4M4L7_9AGAM|nr:hypothetical protein B0F90DRAFT_1715619 [Multifurca ochricompacta]